VRTYKNVSLSPFLKRMIRNKSDDYGVKFERHRVDLLRVWAKMGRDYVSQYPPEGSYNTNRSHWRRGIGMVYISKKTGRMKIYERSQLLFTRWAISQFPNAVVLYNTATYDGLVHTDANQRFVHTANGWRTDKLMIEYLEQNVRRTIAGGVMKLVRVL
jgi:hypothetical protein